MSFEKGRKDYLSSYIGETSAGKYWSGVAKGEKQLREYTIFFLKNGEETLQKQSIELEYKDKKFIPGSAFILNNKLYKYGYYQNKEDKIFYIFTQQFNIETFDPIGTPKKIESIPYIYGEFIYGKSLILPSPDNKKLLLLSWERNRGTTTYNIKIFDDEINLIRSDIESLPEELFSPSLHNLRFGNDGTIAILSQYYSEKQKLLSGSKKKMGVIIHNKSNEFKYYSFKTLQDDQMVCPTLEFNDKNELILASLVKRKVVVKKKTKSKVIGFEIYKLTTDVVDEPEPILTHNFKASDQFFIDQSVEITWATHKFSEGVFTKLIERESGGYFLTVQEGQKITNSSTSTDQMGNRSSSSSEEYFLNDLRVYCFDEAENLVWTHKIKKWQTHNTSTADFYSAIEAFTKNDELFILYNDDAKNHDGDGKASKRAYDRKAKLTSIRFVKITETGMITNKQLLPLKAENRTLTFYKSAKKSDGTIMLSTQTPEKFQFFDLKVD